MGELEIFTFISVGVFSGVVSGLFGVGGGTVIVPALVLVFLALGFPSDYLMQFAIGSSFALIALNSLFAAWEHYKRGAVIPAFAVWAAPFMVVGVLVGSMLAVVAPQSGLVIAFSIFLLAVATQMAFDLKPAVSVAKTDRAISLPGAGAAVCVGGLSAFFGIGGGSMIVPWLNVRGFSPHQSVGTSSLCGVFLSAFGAVGFMVADAPSLIQGGHSGFVYWPAVVLMMITSYPGVKLGVAIAHRLNGQYLKKIFALYLIVVITVLNGVI